MYFMVQEVAERQMSRVTTKLQEKASAESFLLVYPDGYKKFWNECRKTASSEANIENIDEMVFFDAMINYFKMNYRINDRQVFAIGTSGGGHMVYKLALLTRGKFRAITAIIANLPDDENMDCAGVNAPLPVMVINGTDDPVIPTMEVSCRQIILRQGLCAQQKKHFGTGRTLQGIVASLLKMFYRILIPQTENLLSVTCIRNRISRRLFF